MGIEFSSAVEMQKIKPLADEFFANVLFDDEKSFFISDEATVWDVSFSATGEELIQRISSYYNQTVTLDDLKQPLWKLLRQLDRRRTPKAGSWSGRRRRVSPLQDALRLAKRIFTGRDDTSRK